MANDLVTFGLGAPHQRCDCADATDGEEALRAKRSGRSLEAGRHSREIRRIISRAGVSESLTSRNSALTLSDGRGIRN